MAPSSLLSPLPTYIGNDLVDLTCLSPRANRLDQAYLHKICTLLEKQAIHSSQDPVRRLATYWAIKEAAYKVYVQQTGHRFFRPKAFEVYSTETENKGYVRTPLGRLFFQEQQLPAYVHVTCMQSSQAFINLTCKVVPLEEASKYNRSHTLKEIACCHLTRTLGLPKYSLTIHTNIHRIPSVQDAHGPISVSLSLSHDGNWGAYAFSIPHCFLRSSSKLEKEDIS